MSNTLFFNLKNKLFSALDKEDSYEWIPRDEIKLINDFLSKFVFLSDSTTKETIDLKLALKALPNKVDEHNVYRIGMLNFTMI